MAPPFPWSALPIAWLVVFQLLLGPQVIVGLGPTPGSACLQDLLGGPVGEAEMVTWRP